MIDTIIQRALKADGSISLVVHTWPAKTKNSISSKSSECITRMLWDVGRSTFGPLLHQTVCSLTELECKWEVEEWSVVVQVGTVQTETFFQQWRRARQPKHCDALTLTVRNGRMLSIHSFNRMFGKQSRAHNFSGSSRPRIELHLWSKVASGSTFPRLFQKWPIVLCPQYWIEQFARWCGRTTETHRHMKYGLRQGFATAKKLRHRSRQLCRVVAVSCNAVRPLLGLLSVCSVCFLWNASIQACLSSAVLVHRR